MSTTEWIAQGIGVIGLILFIGSFQIKSNRALLICQMIANCMFALQFILLGAYSGCFSLLAIVLRNVVLTSKEKYEWAKWKGWMYVFVAIPFVLMIVTWNGWSSILPFLATGVSTVFYWSDNALHYRAANLFCACPCWLVYDFIFKSYAGMLNESITITSIVISIIRFGWKSLGENKFGENGTEENDAEAVRN